jgi:hypothetical protein
MKGKIPFIIAIVGVVVWLAFIVSTISNCHSPKIRPPILFKPAQRVMVTEGFYQGCKGVIRDHRYYTYDRDSDCPTGNCNLYTVQVDTCGNRDFLVLLSVMENYLSPVLEIRK